jgi:steroid delta-isomerase-like uncharacterized protein
MGHTEFDIRQPRNLRSKPMPVPTAIDAAVLTKYPARYFAAWSQRDIEVALELFTPGLSWIDPSLPAEMTSRKEAQGFFEAAWQGFPDLAFVAVGEPLVDVETGRVAHEWRMTGTHTGEGFPPGVPPTGKPFDVAGTDVWQVDADGRALSVRAYYDVAALLSQLGLV